MNVNTILLATLLFLLPACGESWQVLQARQAAELEEALNAYNYDAVEGDRVLCKAGDRACHDALIQSVLGKGGHTFWPERGQ